jgi:hypothetical protein
VTDTPFDSIESAHEYVTLLATQVEEVRRGLAEDVSESAGPAPSRRVDAFRLVDYKLHQLEEHLARSRRILNDLRALRRLLLTERESHASPVAHPSSSERHSATAKR